MAPPVTVACCNGIHCQTSGAPELTMAQQGCTMAPDVKRGIAKP